MARRPQVAPQPDRLAHFLAGRLSPTPLELPIVLWPGDRLDTSDTAPLSVAHGVFGAAREPKDLEHWRADLVGEGVLPELVGRFRSSGRGGKPDTALAVIRPGHNLPPSKAPDSFTVIAILAAYNESDVLPAVLDDLAAQGVQTFLIDNWSTDDTFGIGEGRLGDGVIGIEKWPASGPSDVFEWTGLLTRKQQLAQELDADWFIHQDADELRRSPWPDVSLRDALHHASALGYNAINYTLLDMELTQDTWRPGRRLQDELTWFRPVTTPDRTQVNTWAKGPEAVDLATSGGHAVKFPGRRVFPYNFLLEHYPLRSVEQAKRKVFKDRLARYPTNERGQGWHTHYDDYRLQPDAGFLVPTVDLLHKDVDFDRDFLLERLSGIDLAFELDPPGAKHQIAAGLKRVGLLDQARTLRQRTRRAQA